jgi:hypothetical protein
MKAVQFAVAVACLMSAGLVASAAGEEAAAPTIIPAEALTWKSVSFPDVTVAPLSGDLAGNGLYAIFAKYRAGRSVARSRGRAGHSRGFAPSPRELRCSISTQRARTSVAQATQA